MNVEHFKEHLPNYDDLSEWQQCQYDIMVWMYETHLERNGTYKWVAGHAGCLEDVTFKKQQILKAHKGDAWTYCCGIALEHFFGSWEMYLGDEWYQGEQDMDAKFAWELRAHFFLYDDPPNQRFIRGSGGGIAALGEHMKGYPRSKLLPTAEFLYHTNPSEIQFGDYIQLQNKEDIFVAGGGHSVIAIGHTVEDGKKAIKVFNSNSHNDYGMGDGVGLGWYAVNKEKNGFKRIFHVGSIRGI